MTEAYWSFDLSPLRLGAALLLLALSLLLSWQQYRRGGQRRLEALSETLRFAALLLLAATLLRPERVRIQHEEGLPALAVLLDASGSMATQDVQPASGGDATTRAAWVAPLRDPAAWAELGDRYRIEVADFSAPTDEDPAPGTDLFAPLDEWARRPVAARAIVLASDGDWTEGPSPIEAATRLRGQDTPVFTVRVGSQRYLPDIELLPLRTPAHAQIDEQVHLPFILQSRMPDTSQVTLVLTEQGVERARRTVSVPAMGQLSSSLSFFPRQLGEWSYTLRAEPVPGETRTDNNERSFRMAVRRETIHILIVETEPRWEYRYLRNAAWRDPAVEVETLLLHPKLPAGGGARYLPAFPASREDLAKYDVVFLGDVGLGEGGLAEDQCRWLRELVESQASGLVFMPGPSGRWATLATSPLADLMPVEIDAENPRGHGAPLAGQVALTMRGRDHRLTRLAPLPEQNERLWANLPGLFWYAPAVRARPDAEVLAVHAQARNADGRIPLIATRPFGSGKVLYMGHDSAWRWRRGFEDLYHYRFWSQAFRWMSYQRHLAQNEGIRFFFTPESPTLGDRLWVQATPFDAQGLPLEGASVDATLAMPSGAVQSFALRAAEGAWGVYLGDVPLREGGSHTLTVRCRETGREVEGSVDVRAPEREPLGRPARPDVLREIAAITGGLSAGTEDLALVVDALHELPPRAPRETRFRLWAHPAWLALIAFAFGADWSCRKLLGRI